MHPVQPRVCGECNPASNILEAFDGSAPRVRGMHRSDISEQTLRRFSPACAGNACCISSTPGPLSVQPRVCGECLRSRKVTMQENGSAPRVRGMPANSATGAPDYRFSPACAGNACSETISRRWRSVQPRVCGECSRKKRAPRALDGSAPRVRGMRFPVLGHRVERRFSPACAGNARAVQRASWSTPVQPRVCGECTVFIFGGKTVNGSAPRVRGMRRP